MTTITRKGDDDSGAEYRALRKRYLEPRTVLSVRGNRGGRGAVFGGLRSNGGAEDEEEEGRQQDAQQQTIVAKKKPSVLDESSSPAYKSLRREISRLEHQQDHASIYRLLQQLSAWERSPHRNAFPSVTAMPPPATMTKMSTVVTDGSQSSTFNRSKTFSRWWKW